MVVTQARWNALDAIQTIDTLAHAHPLAFGSAQEEFLDILRHQTSLLRADIGSAYPRQVYLRSGQCDAGGLFQLCQLLRTELLYLSSVFFDTRRVDGDFTQHIFQADLVERQQLTNHVENTVAQLSPDLFQLAEETVENGSLDGIRRDKIEDIDIRTLPDTRNAPHTLFQPVGVPGNVVVNHQVTELEVDAFTCRLGGDTNLRRLVKALSRFAPEHSVHPAMDLTGCVAPFLQVTAQVFQRVTMFGKDQQFASPIVQLVELCPFDTRAQGFELGFFTRGCDFGCLLDELLQRLNLGTQLIDPLHDREVLHGLFLLFVQVPAITFFVLVAAGGQQTVFLQNLLMFACGQALKFLQDVPEVGGAAFERAVYGVQAASETAL